MAQSLTLKELEEKLGPPSEFILSGENRGLLARWAIARGFAPVQVYAMSGIDLTNLYCEQGDTEINELRRVAADILLHTMQHVQSAKVDPELLRLIVQDEVAKLPPKQIQINTPTSSIVLDGVHHYMTEKLLRVCALGDNIMAVGPAGCGKTTIGQFAARALQLPFYITSNVAEAHELTGFIDATGKYHSKPFRQAFENGGLWVADEIDAWDAGALLAANAALANGICAVPDRDEPVYMHPNFRVFATANTFGNGADRVYIGRNQLDAASLDRFAMVRVDYDLTLERILCNGNVEWLEYVWNVRKIVQQKKIRHVVSTRAIAKGSRALLAGLERNDVEEFYLWKGISENDREKITTEL